MRRHYFLPLLTLWLLGATTWGQPSSNRAQLGVVNTASATTDMTQRVHRALNRMLSTFPILNLQDVYKSCFQEALGTGHLVGTDRRSAMVAYINRECATLQPERLHSTPPYEYVGIDSLYVRVNLSCVVDGIISADTLADCFMAGAFAVDSMHLAAWQSRWDSIMHCLTPYRQQLGNFRADSIAIAQRLRSGHYDYHHSQRFNEAYDYHYRLVRRDIFDSRLRPRLVAAQHQ